MGHQETGPILTLLSHCILALLKKLNRKHCAFKGEIHKKEQANKAMSWIQLLTLLYFSFFIFLITVIKSKSAGNKIEYYHLLFKTALEQNITSNETEVLLNEPSYRTSYTFVSFHNAVQSWDESRQTELLFSLLPGKTGGASISVAHLFFFSFFIVTVLVKKKKVVVIKPDFTGIKRRSRNKRLDVQSLYFCIISAIFIHSNFSFTLITHLRHLSSRLSLSSGPPALPLVFPSLVFATDSCRVCLSACAACPNGML